MARGNGMSRDANTGEIRARLCCGWDLALLVGTGDGHDLRGRGHFHVSSSLVVKRGGSYWRHAAAGAKSAASPPAALGEWHWRPAGSKCYLLLRPFSLPC